MLEYLLSDKDQIRKYYGQFKHKKTEDLKKILDEISPKGLWGWWAYFKNPDKVAKTLAIDQIQTERGVLAGLPTKN